MANPRVMAAHVENWNTWRRRDFARVDDTEAFHLGALAPTAVVALENAGTKLSSADVVVTAERFKHLARDTKAEGGRALYTADLARLPEIIASPRAVLRDRKKPDDLLLVFDPVDEARKGKVVVRVNYWKYVKLDGGEKRKIKSISVRSAGYVGKRNLGSPLHDLIEGEIE